MYKKWKSIAEDLPIEDNGLILKIVCDAPHDEDDTKYFYYGYRVGTYIFVTALLKDNEIICMSWKMTKEYDFDQIYWLYDSSKSIQSLVEMKEISKNKSNIKFYGSFIKLNKDF